MFQVESPITMTNATKSLQQGIVALNAGESEFSLAALAHSDSSALAVLLAWQRHAQQRGQRVQFLNVPTSLLSFATLYGVEQLINVPVTASSSSSTSLM